MTITDEPTQVESLYRLNLLQREVIAEQRELLEVMRRAIPREDTILFGDLTAGQFVRVWGEALEVVAKRSEHDLFGRNRHWLILRDDDGVSHEYEAGEIEPFDVVGF